MTTRKLAGDHCRCAGCGEYFNSTRAFDMHRRGEWPDRRCLSPNEMQTKGMAKSSKDWWCTALRTGDQA